MRDYVVFSDVSKYYQMGQMVIKAIDHINFSIAKGEFCIIVGPSGAGKTTVLNMLSLAGIPLLASARGEDAPIIIGGGHCAYNPEPIADFFDIFSIGEGEEALPELARLYISMKQDGTYTRAAFLHAAAKLDGFYVPSLYAVDYNPDGTISLLIKNIEL